VYISKIIPESITIIMIAVVFIFLTSQTLEDVLLKLSEEDELNQQRKASKSEASEKTPLLKGLEKKDVEKSPPIFQRKLCIFS